jgi:hypothetical protein
LINLVTLEGPDDVSKHCQILETRLTLEAAQIIKLFYQPEAKKPIGLHNDGMFYKEARLKRASAKRDLIASARTALGYLPRDVRSESPSGQVAAS